MHLDINADAIFIADAHYNKNRTSFKIFLDDILNQKIQTTQLFLLGDIFDVLNSQINYFINANQTIIDKLNQLSKQIQIIYIEGNHDFNLQNLFPNIYVIKKADQPLIANYQNKKIAIAHGDIFSSFTYNIYSFIIRNKYILPILNLFNLTKLENYLMQKNICHKNIIFDKFATKRIKLYDKFNIDMIIEGHFHQGKKYNNYINLPAFACNNQYLTIYNLRFLALI
jgi:UDP-2,3-diacylglucosamine hydrolase